MRTFVVGALVGMLIAPLFATGQSAKPRGGIWLGTQLVLGLSQDAVVPKLAESYNLRTIEPPAGLREKGVTSIWIVEEKGEGGKHRSIGVVTFSAGKLSGVRKDLLPPGADEVEFGRQLYLVMRELESEGNSRCGLETDSTEVPDFSRKTAKFQCGQKTIAIELQKFKGYSESVQLYEELNAR
jgi:hypothetical protein